ncbi:MAG TPA: ATP-binding protein [Ktedonobacteraceae bacterium]|nr:ATP-binding protein [Ktedonobacteraceae bacterium]
MSWSQIQQSEDVHEQMAMLVGSAIRLFGGEAGAFVLANEAFDPRSSAEAEITPYRLSDVALALFLEQAEAAIGSTGAAGSHAQQPLAIEWLTPEVAAHLGYEQTPGALQRCSLAVYDAAGTLGMLSFVRPADARSRFEQHEGPTDALSLFIAQLAASMRLALKAQALTKEQGRLAAIFHSSTEGILTVDTALRIIDFNPAMEHFTGWRESEVLGRFYFDVLRPKDRHGNELGLEASPILQAFAGQQVTQREMMISARDGQRFLVLVTASCVRSARGEPMNGILNVRDVTRERQQEEQRSTFISVISHELQTPIAIIKGYASTLTRPDASFDSKTLHPRLTAMEEEADRLNKLVGNLLYASRIQAGGLQMDVTSLDLGPVIHGMVRRFRVKNPEASFALKLSPDLPTVMADRERIEEVLQNLIENALKYSPHQRCVEIACNATSTEVIVSVSDSGMGISLREQEHIFERFHRVGEPLAQATPGAGLGLYICRAIVEAHGGRIWVESTLRQGSTFSFSLPREEQAQLPMVVF